LTGKEKMDEVTYTGEPLPTGHDLKQACWSRVFRFVVDDNGKETKTGKDQSIFNHTVTFELLMALRVRFERYLEGNRYSNKLGLSQG
jgi:hypothetical protein